MDWIEFTVDGAVVPKGRPRVTTINGHTHAYTPSKTKEYEQKVKDAYKGNKTFFDGEYLTVMIHAYYPMPKSASEKQKDLMRIGEIRPTKRPDLDNVAKTICDALNGVAYKDDSQIVRLVISKWYAEFPRVVVSIKEVGW